MAHQRQVIRAAVLALLLNATAAEARVHATRVLPYQASQVLPVIAIYTPDEDVDDDSWSTAPLELTRNLSLIIEGWVSPGENADNAMDDLAKEIEDAMDSDLYLGGAIAKRKLVKTETEVLEESDRQLGWFAMTYEVTYRTLAPEPPADGEMDDFNTAGTAYNQGGEQAPADEASDEITVQA